MKIYPAPRRRPTPLVTPLYMMVLKAVQFIAGNDQLGGSVKQFLALHRALMRENTLLQFLLHHQKEDCHHEYGNNTTDEKNAGPVSRLRNSETRPLQHQKALAHIDNQCF